MGVPCIGKEFILARERKSKFMIFFNVITRERKTIQRLGDFLLGVAVISPNVNLKKKCSCFSTISEGLF